MKKWLLLTLFPLFFVACKSGPDVTLCVIDSQSLLMICSDSEKNQKMVRLDGPEADNYVCMSPDDFSIFLEWAERRCSR